MIGLKNGEMVSRYLTIEMNGKPFNVRVYHTDIETKTTKKTLVITHGFLGTSLAYLNIIGKLIEKYHLVLFDNICWGLNTRLSEEETPKKEDEIEQFYFDFLEGTFNAMDEEGILPEKFYLSGQSYGGYFASLYASIRP